MKSVFLSLALTLTLTSVQAQSPCDWFDTDFSLDEWNAIVAHPSVALVVLRKAAQECPQKSEKAALLIGFVSAAINERYYPPKIDAAVRQDLIALQVCSAGFSASNDPWNVLGEKSRLALADLQWTPRTEYEFEWAEDFGDGLALVLRSGPHYFMDHEGHRYNTAFTSQDISPETEAVFLAGGLPIAHSAMPANSENIKLLIVDAEVLPSLTITAAQLPNLQTLIIQGKKTHDRSDEKPLPVTIPLLPSLRKLVIARAQPLNLPAALVEMPHLQTLHLMRTHLERLPNELGGLRELEELIVENEGLGRLPGSFEELQKLRRLSLADCAMKEFPDVIYKLDSLEALDLSSNAFEALPQEIGNLMNLSWLNLRFAQLTEIPAALFTLPRLEYLNLSENAIQAWPMDQAKMPLLKELDLHNNFHGNVHLDPRNFPSLCKLNLSMPYSMISAEALSFLTQIQILDLSDLELEDLPEEIKKLKQLKFLILATNNSLDAQEKGIKILNQMAKWLPGCEVMIR